MTTFIIIAIVIALGVALWLYEDKYDGRDEWREWE